jgi:hypothetical protein
MGVIALSAVSVMAPGAARAVEPGDTMGRAQNPMPQASAGREGSVEHRASGTGTDVMGHPSTTTGGVAGASDARAGERTHTGTGTATGAGGTGGAAAGSNGAGAGSMGGGGR